MANPPIKLILCDLGNVLIDFDHRIAVRKIKKFSPRSTKEIYRLFFDSHLTKDFEEGRVTSLEFFRKMARKLALKNVSFADFVVIWNDIFFENEGMLDVLRRLKKKYRLHLISNINELHYQFIQKTFPKHLSVFDKIYCSHQVGRRKPDVLIYRRAMADAGVRPQNVLYTDDRKDLIQEAKKLGIRTLLFKNVKDFTNQLKKFDIFL
ncbi:MAG: HAD family phosphatase [Candidatus Omnitrophota bacterium]